MEFVLNGFKKRLRYLCIFVVVNTALLIDVGYFKVKASFAGTYLADTLEEFIEIIFTEPGTLF